MAGDRLIEAFESAAFACRSLEALQAPVEDAARELGFDYVALLHHDSVGRDGAQLIRIDNYPPGWEAVLRAMQPSRGDPVHCASKRALTGFTWAQVRSARLSPLDLEIFALARDFGLGDGFTVPANVPGEPTGSCSFVVQTGRALPADRLLRAEQLGLHAFEAARRIRKQPVSRAPRLSRRELDVLRLLAGGKSDWEIAAILGIAHETVRQYVKRARAAYGVATRTQLAVHALRDGLIRFDEAIPPNGGIG